MCQLCVSEVVATACNFRSTITRVVLWLKARIVVVLILPPTQSRKPAVAVDTLVQRNYRVEAAHRIRHKPENKYRATNPNRPLNSTHSNPHCPARPGAHQLSSGFLSTTRESNCSNS